VTRCGVCGRFAGKDQLCLQCRTWSSRELGRICRRRIVSTIAAILFRIENIKVIVPGLAVGVSDPNFACAALPRDRSF